MKSFAPLLSHHSHALALVTSVNVTPARYSINTKMVNLEKYGDKMILGILDHAKYRGEAYSGHVQTPFYKEAETIIFNSPPLATYLQHAVSTPSIGNLESPLSRCMTMNQVPFQCVIHMATNCVD
ncbi:hypothetical protein VNO77_24359 [Canavalia gladiata]|uniref:Uncharacterized protein n=1 Tax=Canavalia gladiata TaxID=3824 RepID=A0AAN9L8M8_CANGL